MVKIIIDSTFCASKTFIEEHNIEVVNLNILFNDKTIKEGFEDSWESFYSSLKKSKKFPKTSQPSPVLYEELFKKSLETNEEILVLTLSSSLSGTYNAARIAAENISSEKIFVVDSMQCSQSAFLILEETVRLRDSGLGGKELAEKCAELTPKACIEFVPETMEYLKRGGRISLVKALIASILNIKPILSFKNNSLTVAKKALGMGMALNEMVKAVPKTVKEIFVCCVDKSKFTQALKEKVLKVFPKTRIRDGLINPVVGSHVGPGSVGIAYIEE